MKRTLFQWTFQIFREVLEPISPVHHSRESQGQGRVWKIIACFQDLVFNMWRKVPSEILIFFRMNLPSKYWNKSECMYFSWVFSWVDAFAFNEFFSPWTRWTWYGEAPDQTWLTQACSHYQLYNGKAAEAELKAARGWFWAIWINMVCLCRGYYLTICMYVCMSVYM